MKKFLQIFSVLLLSCISVVAIGMAKPQTASAESCAWIADSQITCGDAKFYLNVQESTEKKVGAIFREKEGNNWKAGRLYFPDKVDNLLRIITQEEFDGLKADKKVGTKVSDVLNTEKIECRIYQNDVGGNGQNETTKCKTDEDFLPPDATGLTKMGNADEKNYFICGIKSQLDHKCFRGVDGPLIAMTEENVGAVRLDAGSAQEEQCRDDAGALGFFLCPLQNLVTQMIKGVLDIFTNLLTVPPLKQDNKPLTDAVGTVRAIANSFYVVIFLIIIFANFIAIPGLDNYSIKKLLPKLITVIILTQFSYLICSVMVDMGNIAGQTIPGIVAKAGDPVGYTTTNAYIAENLFNPIKDITSLLKSPTLTGSSALALEAQGLFAFGWIIEIFILVVSIISLFYMMFRWFGIMLLTIVAPIAFAAWVLPNTEKFAKMWITAFIKLTLMYVLVMGMLVVAAISKRVLFAAADNGGSAVAPYVAIFIPVIAIALIPKCLKVSSSMLTAAGKMAADSRAAKAASGAAKGAVKKSGQEGKLAELKGKGFGAAGKAVGGNTGLNMEAKGEQLKKAKSAKEKDTMSKLPFTRQLAEAQLSDPNAGNKTAKTLMGEKLGELSNKGSLSATEYAQLKTLRAASGQSTAGFTEDINLSADGKPMTTATPGNPAVEVMGQYDNPVYNYRGGGGGGTQQPAGGTQQANAGGGTPITAPPPPPGGGGGGGTRQPSGGTGGTQYPTRRRYNYPGGNSRRTSNWSGGSGTPPNPTPPSSPPLGPPPPPPGGSSTP